MNRLPYEATTERIANRALGEHSATAAWIFALDAEDQTRFFEIVHHVAHYVFEEAIYRTGRVPLDAERADEVLQMHGIDDATSNAILDDLRKVEGVQ